MSQATVLVVDDDAVLRDAVSDTLELSGYNIRKVDGGDAALKALEDGEVGMVVSDVQMSPMDGHQLLLQVKARFPAIPVLLMTAYGDMEKAVAAIQDGATDYIAKPFEPEVLLEKVNKVVVQPVAHDNALIAEDLRTRELQGLARRVARSEATVMIGGSSGTGKEVFAQYIHRQSSRSEGPFVAINCAAIPENMLEAVLFGYEKGAYTGAHRSAPGKFELAQDGTLLLDEVSEMSLGLQAKLLRVLQEREVERLGGRKVIRLNVRVLATSNRNLREEVAAGRFREDLFYRLNVFPIHLPPLCERQRDILPLARFLLQRHCRNQYITEPRISPAASKRLVGYSWPGNVRELDNVMQRAMILCNGTEISNDDLSFELDSQISTTPVVSQEEDPRGLSDDLRSVEEQLILDALKDGTRKRAAERLGISQRTLRYKIARLRDAGVAIP
ncbi:MAG: sigma-54-dependent Fis family transcriptional regulator [Gammaproteobacteria bacterium]|nr:sigma-54-dependent Fis family transcriptional regulator [Gammaproteobacteria bacterium]